MKILITNDDGIQGEGLRLLTEWAMGIGEVTVVAPKEEQSACSHSITLKPFEVKESDAFADLGVTAYTVASTPADCVRIGIALLGPFDVVFSGINNGFNAGHFIAYSGTCAACFEANLEGVPAIAFSTNFGCLKEAAAHLPAVYDFMRKNGLFRPHSLYNVNIPPVMKGCRITTQENTFSQDQFIPATDDRYKAKLCLAKWTEEGADLTKDISAFFAGWCSITPLTSDRSDYKTYEELSKLNES